MSEHITPTRLVAITYGAELSAADIAALCRAASIEAYYGGDSPGSYGPSDPKGYGNV